jgi:formamidopyrimidine-DNA glycosylase
VLIIHLRMSGQLLRAAPKDPVDKHNHVTISFTQGGQLRFVDPRTFGEMFLATPDEITSEIEELSTLGVDPVETPMSWVDFGHLLRSKRMKLKAFLTDQSMIAGIGNIYADEILFESGIHPLASAAGLSRARASRLWAAMRTVLAKAVAAGGSTIRSYRNADGEVGHFQDDHQVYGRTGEPCRHCGRPVRRKVIGGRSSHFCSRCQK